MSGVSDDNDPSWYWDDFAYPGAEPYQPTGQMSQGALHAMSRSVSPRSSTN